MANGHWIKRGDGYGVVMVKKKRETASLSAHSAAVDKFITVNLLEITLFTKAECATVVILSHSTLCICKVLVSFVCTW